VTLDFRFWILKAAISEASIRHLPQARRIKRRRGKNGSKGRNILKSQDEIIVLPSKVTRKIRRDEIVIIETPGGGGYGVSSDQ